jgi:2'-5' RNA ligase
MGYAIELKLNENSAQQVLELWENLAAESISSLMLDIGSWPHISLAVFENIDPIVLRQMLSRFASETSPFSVILASVGAFPGDAGAVFLAPVVTQELLEIHRRFHRLLEDTGLECMGYYLPGSWIPHCTVAFGVEENKIGTAAEMCLRSGAFGRVGIDEVCLIESHPVREIYSFPLGGQGAGMNQ